MPSIALESIVWDAIGDDPFDTGRNEDAHSVLLGCITIGGTHFHAEAIEVTTDDDGEQIAVPATKVDFLRELQDREGIEFQTVEIADRNYVLVILPYGA